MDRLRVGLVGLGAFGSEHVRAWRAVPEADVVAVCDRAPALLAHVADQYAIADRYLDWRDLLAHAQVDAIDLVTPEDAHVAPAVAALAAGKHVLVEKPVATTLEDADRIIAAARESAAVAMVGHVLRFDTRYGQVKDLIVAGQLGKVASIYARRNNTRAQFGTYKRVFPPLVNILHDIDLALWYVGEPVARVYCTAHRAASPDRADVYWIQVQFAGGALAVFESSWLIPDGAPSSIDACLEVVGTEGTVHVTCTESGLAVWGHDATQWPDTQWWPVVGGASRGALRDELAHFAACALAGRQSEVLRLQEARAALQVVLLAQRSLDQGMAVGP